MNKKARAQIKDMDFDFIQVIAEDGDLAKKLERALSARIAREISGKAPKRSPKKKGARDE